MCRQWGVMGSPGLEHPECPFFRVSGFFSAQAYTQPSNLLTNCLVYGLKQVGGRKWFRENRSPEV